MKVNVPMEYGLYVITIEPHTPYCDFIAVVQDIYGIVVYITSHGSYVYCLETARQWVDNRKPDHLAQYLNLMNRMADIHYNKRNHYGRGEYHRSMFLHYWMIGATITKMQRNEHKLTSNK